jgi:hypothetical protein
MPLEADADTDRANRTLAYSTVMGAVLSEIDLANRSFSPPATDVCRGSELRGCAVCGVKFGRAQKRAAAIRRPSKCTDLKQLFTKLNGDFVNIFSYRREITGTETNADEFTFTCIGISERLVRVFCFSCGFGFTFGLRFSYIWYMS